MYHDLKSKKLTRFWTVSMRLDKDILICQQEAGLPTPNVAEGCFGMIQ